MRNKNRLTQIPLNQTLGFVVLYSLLAALFLCTLIDMVSRFESAQIGLIHVGIGTVTIGVIGIVSFSVKIEYEQVQNAGPWLRGLGLGVWYFSGTLLLRWIWLGDVTAVYTGFAVLQSTSLFLVFGTFDHPIVPNSQIDNVQFDNIPIYLQTHLNNWWRIGQIVLTSTVVVAGGLFVWAFPRGGRLIARNRVAFLALPFAAAYGSVLLFILLKTNHLEGKLVRFL